MLDSVRPSFKADVNIEVLYHQIYDTMLSFAMHAQNGKLINNDAATERAFQQVSGEPLINRQDPPLGRSRFIQRDS